MRPRSRPPADAGRLAPPPRDALALVAAVSAERGRLLAAAEAQGFGRPAEAASITINAGPGQQLVPGLEARHVITPKEFIEFVTRHQSLQDEYCYMRRVGASHFEIIPFAQALRLLFSVSSVPEHKETRTRKKPLLLFHRGT